MPRDEGAGEEIVSSGFRANAPAGSAERLASPKVEVSMKWMPAGTFTMGSPESEPGRNDDEGPQRSVTLSGFWLMEHEVTQGQFQALMGRNPSHFKDGADWRDRPVEQVTWFDAVEFCNALTAAMNAANPDLNLRACYRIDWIERDSEGRITAAEVEWIQGSNGFRLPTEAEWEYACRAGTQTAYSFGDDPRQLVDHAWFEGNSGDRTHAVKGKRANAWGLHDMHGNVWEWCWDWFGRYEGVAATDPQGPRSGTLRVLRGGRWNRSSYYCRASNRNDYAPGFVYDYYGFRAARTP
jgi:formylglycine-generating enzyme required for sulfatase activity